MSISKKLINTGGESEYTLFDSIKYTGPTNSVDLNLTPDLVYIKMNTAVEYGVAYDTSRGNSKALFPGEPNAEYNGYPLTLRDGGFNPANYHNGTIAKDYIAYAWKAGGAPVTNNDGNRTCQVSANVDGGFSIVTYTGSCYSEAKLGHGLSQAPEFIIVKNREQPYNWAVYHVGMGNTKYIYWDTPGVQQTAPNNTSWWTNTSPTSTVFDLGNNNEVNCFGTFVAYCWHSVPGISKVGGYLYTNVVGYSNRVITGFKPKMVMVKNWNSYTDWYIFDSSLSTTDSISTYVKSSTTGTWETNATNEINFEDDGFWFTNSGTPSSTLGYQYYIAFADESV